MGNIVEFSGGRNILFPLSRGKKPENNECKENQPGKPEKIMKCYRAFEPEKLIGAMNFKARDDQENNQRSLNLMPETFKSRIQIYFDHFFIFGHGYFLLPFLKKIRPRPWSITPTRLERTSPHPV
jgi:hypothetical protein